MAEPAKPAGRRRLRSGLVGALAVAAVTILFVLGATLGLVAHLNTAAGRRAPRA
jgi:hypothetical protein